MGRRIRAVLSREDTGVKEGGGVGEKFGGSNINPEPGKTVSLSFGSGFR
jgi:hypothetical protein